MTDHELLATYANGAADKGETHAQQAFREVVQRHQDWVYAACLRRVRDPDLADDAVQGVFVALARRAGKIAHSQRPLEGWLHKAARFAAANLLRSEARRARHELRAATMKSESASESDTALWQKIEAQLEPAMDRLSPADRQAILLRFYRKQTHAQVAAALAISEEAAKKRIARALEKLRASFKKRGVEAEAISVGPLLLGHAASPVPAALNAALAYAGSAGASMKAATIAKGVLTMASMKAKVALVLGVAAAVAVATAVTVPLLHSWSNAAPTPNATGSGAAPMTTAEAELRDAMIQSIKNVNTALRSFDGPRFTDLVYAKTDDEKTIIAEMNDRIAASIELRNAMYARFDQKEVDKQLSQAVWGLGIIPDEWLAKAEIKSDGDSGEIGMKVIRDRYYVYLHVVRENGIWKRCVSEERLQGTTPAESRQYSNRSRRIIQKITQEVTDGQFKSVEEVIMQYNQDEIQASKPSQSSPATAP